MVCCAPGRSTMTIFALVGSISPIRRARDLAALPRAKLAFGQRLQIIRGNIPGHDQGRVIRHVVRLPEIHHVVARHRLDGFLGARIVVPERECGPEQRRNSGAGHDHVRDRRARRRTRPGATRGAARLRPAEMWDAERCPRSDRARPENFWSASWLRRVDPSMLALEESVAPSSAASSAICVALRVLVPCCSMFAVKLARPGLSTGLAPLPVLKTRFAATTGRPGR